MAPGLRAAVLSDESRFDLRSCRLLYPKGDLTCLLIGRVAKSDFSSSADAVIALPPRGGRSGGRIALAERTVDASAFLNHNKR